MMYFVISLCSLTLLPTITGGRGGLAAEIRKRYLPARLHRRLMRADAGAGPIHRLIDIRKRRPALDDAGHEFVHQVRMRPAVAAALDERQMRVALVVNTLGGETLDRRPAAAGRNPAP